MSRFYTIWFGQFISTLGSSITSFAIGIWLFTETGSVTAYSLTLALYLLPIALASPFAGAIVDRYDRRTILIVADSVQAMTTVVLGLLLYANTLQIWHIYAVIVFSSSAQAFQMPAWSASIPLIVPKQQLGRAAAMGRLNQAIGRVAAPVLAGTFIVPIGLSGIIAIDFVTFLFALGSLLLVHIPNPPQSLSDTETQSLWRDIVIGWQYLFQRRGLFVFVIILSLRNLFLNFALALTVPLGLTLTTEAGVGTMMSIISIGLVIGSFTMSIWRGPERRIRWYLTWLLVEGLTISIAGLRPSLPLMTLALFINFLAFAISSPIIAPVIQTKVALGVQGRVFAMISFLGMILEPMGEVAVGPLVDYVLEPGMLPGGMLAPIFGNMIGTGTGRGMALVFVVMGGFIMLLGVYGYLNPRVYCLENELPDVGLGETPRRDPG